MQTQGEYNAKVGFLKFLSQFRENGLTKLSVKRKLTLHIEPSVDVGLQLNLSF